MSFELYGDLLKIIYQLRTHTTRANQCKNTADCDEGMILSMICIIPLQTIFGVRPSNIGFIKVAMEDILCLKLVM